MTYKVQVSRGAQKSVESLDKPVRRRVLGAIGALAGEPRPKGCLRLSGQPAWRIRIGKIRVIYEIHDKILVVTVIDVGYRREVYQ